MRIPYITSALALVLIASCGSNPEGHALHATDAPAVPIPVDSVVSPYNFTFGRPMLPDSGGIVLIPLSMIEKQGEESRKDFLSSKGRGQNLPPYWNVLFLDPNTLGTHMLSDGKMWIREIHVPQLAAEEALSGYVLYELTDTDGNKDGKVNGDDPTHLCISKNDGSQFNPISPIQEDLIGWDILPSTGKIMIRTRQDDNSDGIFEYREQENLLIYDVRTGKTVPVLSDQLKREMKRSFVKYWPQDE